MKEITTKTLNGSEATLDQRTIESFVPGLRVLWCRPESPPTRRRGPFGAR